MRAHRNVVSTSKWFVVAMLALAAAGSATAQVEAEKPSACVGCHEQLVEHLLEPLEHWDADVHREIGLGCVGCHGGNPAPELVDDAEASMSPAAGFRPKPERLQIAEFCGNCHADVDFIKRFNPRARVDQLAEYRTSTHGIRALAGDPVPATCTDCHGVHGIRRVNAPDSPVHARNVPETCARCHANAEMMEPYGIPTDQHAEYLKSEHAAALLVRGDTGAPACNDCHGNHGAAPPGVASVANVCGQCHVRETQLFRASLKKDLFDAMDVTECSVCHGNHAIVYPTSELFRSGSEPTTTRGEVLEADPLRAELGGLESGAIEQAVWTLVLSPHLNEGPPPGLHRVSVTAQGAEALVLELPLPGGPIAPARTVTAGNDALEATLTAEPLAGPEIVPGSPARLTLAVTALRALDEVAVRELPTNGVHTVAGSVCMQCHSAGDECDVATAKMYAGLRELNQAYGEARVLLHRAEVAGMDVGEALFALKSGGVTAALDARALVHTFDPERVVARAGEAREVAGEAARAGEAALAELQYRRKGLAVSLVLIGLVALGLFIKIRQLGTGT